jgi:porin
MKKVMFGLGLSLGLLFQVKDLSALEINEKLSLEANLTWVHQWLDKRKGDFKDKDRGSAVLDGRLTFKPTEVDEFSIRASFAKENGIKKYIKKYSAFVLSPNADDLRDDLHNINGRARDHLQELWYARTFSLPGNSTLKTTLGIIDGTAFIDDNRFANDELTQFMNEVFVNNPLANIVSYDYGAALQFEKGPFHLRVLGMQSKTDESENKRFHRKNYNYYALQLGYKLETPLGEGNYRIYGFTTNKKFPDWEEEKRKALRGWGVSFDQDLVKDRLGVFFRAGFQDDVAQIDYKSMYSLGLVYKCKLLARTFALGAGYSYLKAPSKKEELKSTRAYEAYLAIPLYEVEKKFSSTLTFDWQYMKDNLKEDTDRKGQIFGFRLNLGF